MTTPEQHAQQIERLLRCLNIPIAEDVAALEAAVIALRQPSALLVSVATQEQTEKALGAGLIHANDTGHGDTLPRPNSEK